MHPRLRPRLFAFVVAYALAGTVGAIFTPSAVAAQQSVGTCRILDGTRNARGRNVGGARVTYVSRPRLACEGGIRINADSMVNFESTGYNQLFGNVFFEDETRQLLSDNARYFDQVGRLEADGNVQLTDKESGNVVSGGNLLYLRAGFGRSEEELTVWGGRARALLVPGGAPDEASAPTADPPGDPEADPPPPPAEPAPRKPYDITGNRIYLRGETYFQATGQVEVKRDSLNAFADTLRYDELGQRLLLVRDARVDQDQYDLEGDEILMHLPSDTLRKVEARGNGRLIGEDLDLDAPFIRVGFEAGALNALWATPLRPGQELEMTVGLRVLPAELDSADLVRPEARSTDFHIVADSLEVQAPNETLEQLFAVGSARAVSSARDSVNTPDTPEFIRRDWMEGDTVVAFFDNEYAGTTAAGTDSTQYVLRRLEARVQAASLYRLEPDSAQAESEGGGDDDPLAEGGDGTGAGLPGVPEVANAAALDSLAAVALMADSVAGAGLARDSAQVADGVTAEGDAEASEAEGTEASERTVIEPGPEPAVHYVTAEEIIILFEDGTVDRMEVKGLNRGIHLDPRQGGRTAGRAP